MKQNIKLVLLSLMMVWLAFFVCFWIEKEIMPIEVSISSSETILITEDAGPRIGTTLEVLSGLKSAFKENGSIHASNK